MCDDGIVSDGQGARVEALERRVERLEAELVALRTERAGPIPSRGAAAPPWPAPVVSPPAWQRQTSPAQPATFDAQRLEIDSETILKWGGVGLVVLAVGFAASTAISRGWIGPELQLAGAIALSLALVAAGVRLRATRPGWTHALCSAGVASAHTTVASNLCLDQTSDQVAYAATAVIAVGGLALAHRIASEWVAAVTLAGGMIAWLVIGRHDVPVVANTVWVALLVGAAIWLAIERRWFGVRVLAHASGMLVLLGIAGEAEGRPEQAVVLVATALLGGSLLRVPSIGDLSETWQQFEVQLAIATASWWLGIVVATFEFDDDMSIGLTAIGAAIVVGGAAYGLRPALHPAHDVSLFVSASVALSIGLAVVLSDPVAFVALAVQGAGLVQLARRLSGSLRVYVNAATAETVAVVYAVGAMVVAWADDAPVGDDLAHLVIVAAAVLAGWWVEARRVRTLTGMVALALVLVWLGSVLVHLPQGQAAVSVAWALVGTGVLVAGAMRRERSIATAGLGVLGLTVGKLLTVDLEEVDTLWRAALFLLVGLGFLRLGFLLPRLTGDRTPRHPTSEPSADGQ